MVEHLSAVTASPVRIPASRQILYIKQNPSMDIEIPRNKKRFKKDQEDHLELQEEEQEHGTWNSCPMKRSKNW